MCASKPSVPKPDPTPPAPEVVADTPVMQTEAESSARKKQNTRRGLSSLRIDLSVPGGTPGLQIPN